jgi:hypothetical protein
MGPLGTNDPEYGAHGQEIQSFSKFCRKLGIFGKTVGKDL